jgi:magnesium chelatase accessory protein
MMVRDAGTIARAWSNAGVQPAAGKLGAVPYDWPLRETSRMIEAAGMTWHAQRMGKGDPLLLIHGTAASTHTWRDLMPLLAKRFDVLAVDLPGHGYSERTPDKSMSLPSLATALRELLEAVDFQPKCIVGHSAGAAIALRMVLDGSVRPEAVIGLNAALLPFGGSMRRIFAPMAKLFATTRLMPALVARRARDFRAVQRVLKGTGSMLDDNGARYYQRLLQREPHVAAVLAMMASWDLGPLLKDLDRLDVPLHLVTGSRDQAVSPGEADAIAAAVDGATVQRIDGLGHLAHEENPGKLAEIVCRLCSQRVGAGCCR